MCNGQDPPIPRACLRGRQPAAVRTPSRPAVLPSHKEEIPLSFEPDIYRYGTIGNKFFVYIRLQGAFRVGLDHRTASQLLSQREAAHTVPNYAQPVPPT